MDLSGLDIESLAQTGPEGKFYLFHYKVILMFGLTELMAQVAWKENVSRFPVIEYFIQTWNSWNSATYQGVEKRYASFP